MSATALPKVLLFDLGGVLVENTMFTDLPKLLSERIDEATLRTRWLASPAVQRFERGQTEPGRFAEDLIAEWKIGLGPDEMLAAFAGWVMGPFPGALDLLARLRGRATVALLTNCNAVHWDRLGEIRDRADHVFSSHHLGLVKPDPRIFARVVAELGCPAGEIGFFDDSIQNVDAARKAGMRGWHTVGFEALETALATLV